MLKALFALVAPPIAVLVYCRARSCAAPVAVFWLTAIVSIFYGLAGGPTQEPGPSLYTILLGLLMWLISSIWALLTIRGSRDDKQGRETHPIDESDPLEDVRKSH